MRFVRKVLRVLVLRSMDSEEENDMVERFRESDIIGLKGDKGPKYDGNRVSFVAPPRR